MVLNKFEISAMECFVSRGGELKLPFREKLCDSDGVSYIILFGKNRYKVMTQYASEVWTFKKFHEAYRFFMKHSDPRINPGIAWNLVRSELMKKFGGELDDHYSDTGAATAIRKIVKQRKWTVKYTAPKAVGSDTDTKD